MRAWGHGPLDATVAINGDGTVSYSVPHVNAGSYAEARVVFPVEWLSGIVSGADNMHESTARLDTVLPKSRPGQTAPTRSARFRSVCLSW